MYNNTNNTPGLAYSRGNVAYITVRTKKSNFGLTVYCNGRSLVYTWGTRLLHKIKYEDKSTDRSAQIP